MSQKAGPILTGFDLHERVIVDEVLKAASWVWIATANLKDMHIAMARGYKPILEVFDQMAARRVHFRIVHSEMPSRPFRATLDRCTSLVKGGLELQVCPRSHWKLVIVDGRFAYMGSANFTGAGLGVKNAKRRNLEIGYVTEDPGLVGQLASLFDGFWIGDHCSGCAFTDRCPDPIAQT